MFDFVSLLGSMAWVFAVPLTIAGVITHYIFKEAEKLER